MSIVRKITKYSETRKETRKDYVPKIWNTVKQVLRGKFLVWSTFGSKQERLKATNVKHSTQESGKRSHKHTPN